VRDISREDFELTRRGFKHYRQAGLGLSATFISLSIILLKYLEPAEVTPCAAAMCKIVFIVAIGSAIGIQIFNYIGTKEQAHAYLAAFNFIYAEKKEEQQFYKKEIKKRDKKANYYYGWADWSVWASAILFFIGAVSWLKITGYIY
jgi:hypothetical protein